MSRVCVCVVVCLLASTVWSANISANYGSVTESFFHALTNISIGACYSHYSSEWQSCSAINSSSSSTVGVLDPVRGASLADSTVLSVLIWPQSVCTAATVPCGSQVSYSGNPPAVVWSTVSTAGTVVGGGSLSQPGPFVSLRGIRGTEVDICSRSSTTFSFSMKAASNASFLVFAQTDDIEIRSNLSSQVTVQQYVLQQALLDELKGDSPALSSFPVNCALFVDGPSKTISWVTRRAGASLVRTDFFLGSGDVQSKVLQGTDIFDGSWHSVAITISYQELYRTTIQLFVDAKTSPSDYEFHRCLSTAVLVADSTLPATPTAFTVGLIQSYLGRVIPTVVDGNVTMNIKLGGIAVYGFGVGSAELYNIQGHIGTLTQRQIVGLGSDSMTDNIAITRTFAIVFAVVALGIALLFFVLSLSHAGMELFRFNLWTKLTGGVTYTAHAVKVDERTLDTEAALASAGGKIGAAASSASNVAATIAQLSAQTAMRAQATAFAVASLAGPMRQLLNIFPQVVAVFQGLALYLRLWDWPEQFRQVLNKLSVIFALDLTIPELRLNASVTFILQFVLCVIIACFLYTLRVTDDVRFEDCFIKFRLSLEVTLATLQEYLEMAKEEENIRSELLNGKALRRVAIVLVDSGYDAQVALDELMRILGDKHVARGDEALVVEGASPLTPHTEGAGSFTEDGEESEDTRAATFAANRDMAQRLIASLFVKLADSPISRDPIEAFLKLFFTREQIRLDRQDVATLVLRFSREQESAGTIDTYLAAPMSVSSRRVFDQMYAAIGLLVAETERSLKDEIVGFEQPAKSIELLPESLFSNILSPDEVSRGISLVANLVRKHVTNEHLTRHGVSQLTPAHYRVTLRECVVNPENGSLTMLSQAETATHLLFVADRTVEQQRKLDLFVRVASHFVAFPDMKELFIDSVDVFAEKDTRSETAVAYQLENCDFVRHASELILRVNSARDHPVVVDDLIASKDLFVDPTRNERRKETIRKQQSVQVVEVDNALKEEEELLSLMIESRNKKPNVSERLFLIDVTSPFDLCCPVHRNPLLTATEAHYNARTGDGAPFYLCAHAESHAFKLCQQNELIAAKFEVMRGHEKTIYKQAEEEDSSKSKDDDEAVDDPTDTAAAPKQKGRRSGRIRRILPESCLQDNLFVCPESCSYALCSRCHDRRVLRLTEIIDEAVQGVVYSALNSPFAWVILFLAVQSLMFPITQNAIMIIACHPTYQCDFPMCYREPSALFIVAVVSACLILVLFRVWQTASFTAVLIRRRKFLAPLVRDYDRIWLWYLDMDTSVLSALYRKYEFSFMVLDPVLQFATQISLCCVASFTTDSSPTQVVATFVAEGANCLFLSVTNLFIDPWMDILTKLGSVHQLAQMGWMSWHRALLIGDPFTSLMSPVMLATSAAYLIVVILITYYTVIKPWQRTLRFERSMIFARREEHALEEIHPELAVATLLQIRDEKRRTYGKSHLQSLVAQALILRILIGGASQEAAVRPLMASDDQTPPRGSTNDKKDNPLLLQQKRGADGEIRTIEESDEVEDRIEALLDADDVLPTREVFAIQFVRMLRHFHDEARNGGEIVNDIDHLNFPISRHSMAALREAVAASTMLLEARPYEECLLNIVELSRRNSSLGGAAANCMSLLAAVKLVDGTVGVFEDYDFSNVHMPGADLSGCSFTRCSFRNANLSQVNFERSFFTQVDFTSAILNEAVFRQRHRVVRPAATFSPFAFRVKDAAFSGGGHIALLDEANNALRRVFLQEGIMSDDMIAGHSYQICHIVVSPEQELEEYAVSIDAMGILTGWFGFHKRLKQVVKQAITVESPQSITTFPKEWLALGGSLTGAEGPTAVYCASLSHDGYRKIVVLDVYQLVKRYVAVKEDNTSISPALHTPGAWQRRHSVEISAPCFDSEYFAVSVFSFEGRTYVLVGFAGSQIVRGFTLLRFYDAQSAKLVLETVGIDYRATGRPLPESEDHCQQIKYSATVVKSAFGDRMILVETVWDIISIRELVLPADELVNEEINFLLLWQSRPMYGGYYRKPIVLDYDSFDGNYAPFMISLVDDDGQRGHSVHLTDEQRSAAHDSLMRRPFLLRHLSAHDEVKSCSELSVSLDYQIDAKERPTMVSVSRTMICTVGQNQLIVAREIGSNKVCYCKNMFRLHGRVIMIGFRGGLLVAAFEDSHIEALVLDAGISFSLNLKLHSRTFVNDVVESPSLARSVCVASQVSIVPFLEVTESRFWTVKVSDEPLAIAFHPVFTDVFFCFCSDGAVTVSDGSGTVYPVEGLQNQDREVRNAKFNVDGSLLLVAGHRFLAVYRIKFGYFPVFHAETFKDPLVRGRLVWEKVGLFFVPACCLVAPDGKTVIAVEQDQRLPNGNYPTGFYYAEESAERCESSCRAVIHTLSINDGQDIISPFEIALEGLMARLELSADGTLVGLGAYGSGAIIDIRRNRVVFVQSAGHVLTGLSFAKLPTHPFILAYKNQPTSIRWPGKSAAARVDGALQLRCCQFSRSGKRVLGYVPNDGSINEYEVDTLRLPALMPRHGVNLEIQSEKIAVQGDESQSDTFFTAMTLSVPDCRYVAAIDTQNRLSFFDNTNGRVTAVINARDFLNASQQDDSFVSVECRSFESHPPEVTANKLRTKSSNLAKSGKFQFSNFFTSYNEKDANIDATAVDVKSESPDASRAKKLKGKNASQFIESSFTVLLMQGTDFTDENNQSSERGLIFHNALGGPLRRSFFHIGLPTTESSTTVHCIAHTNLDGTIVASCNAEAISIHFLSADSPSSVVPLLPMMRIVLSTIQPPSRIASMFHVTSMVRWQVLGNKLGAPVILGLGCSDFVARFVQLPSVDEMMFGTPSNVFQKAFAVPPPIDPHACDQQLQDFTFDSQRVLATFDQTGVFALISGSRGMLSFQLTIPLDEKDDIMQNTIEMLRDKTLVAPFKRGPMPLWRLVSHLSMHYSPRRGDDWYTFASFGLLKLQNYNNTPIESLNMVQEGTLPVLSENTDHIEEKNFFDLTTVTSIHSCSSDLRLFLAERVNDASVVGTNISIDWFGEGSKPLCLLFEQDLWKVVLPDMPTQTSDDDGVPQPEYFAESSAEKVLPCQEARLLFHERVHTMNQLILCRNGLITLGSDGMLRYVEAPWQKRIDPTSNGLSRAQCPAPIGEIAAVKIFPTSEPFAGASAGRATVLVVTHAGALTILCLALPTMDTLSSATCASTNVSSNWLHVAACSDDGTRVAVVKAPEASEESPRIIILESSTATRSFPQDIDVAFCCDSFRSFEAWQEAGGAESLMPAQLLEPLSSTGIGITHMTFNNDNSILAVSTQACTLHIPLNEEKQIALLDDCRFDKYTETLPIVDRKLLRTCPEQVVPDVHDAAEDDVALMKLVGSDHLPCCWSSALPSIQTYCIPDTMYAIVLSSSSVALSSIKQFDEFEMDKREHVLEGMESSLVAMSVKMPFNSRRAFILPTRIAVVSEQGQVAFLSVDPITGLISQQFVVSGLSEFHPSASFHAMFGLVDPSSLVTAEGNVHEQRDETDSQPADTGCDAVGPVLQSESQHGLQPVFVLLDSMSSHLAFIPYALPSQLRYSAADSNYFVDCLPESAVRTILHPAL